MNSPSKLGNCGLSPRLSAGNEQDDEYHEEYEEEDLGDTCGGAGNTRKAQQSSDDGYDEKCERPTEHVKLPVH